MTWGRPVRLKDGSKEDLIYSVKVSKLPAKPGFYIFGRQWGHAFEALYIGQSEHVQKRVQEHLVGNVPLMLRMRKAKTGNRVVIAGVLKTRPGQQLKKCLLLIERAFIRHFLSEGHDLINEQGTRLRQHEIYSDGPQPKRIFPKAMYVNRG